MTANLRFHIIRCKKIIITIYAVNISSSDVVKLHSILTVLCYIFEMTAPAQIWANRLQYLSFLFNHSIQSIFKFKSYGIVAGNNSDVNHGCVIKRS